MPERLDRVQIEVGDRVVELPWTSRDLLLAEIDHVEACKPAVKAIQAAGASRPVALDCESKDLVAQTIDVWEASVHAHGLPAGVWELRNALYDDLRDTETE